MEVSVMRHLPDPFASYHSHPSYQPWDSRKRPSPTEKEQRAFHPSEYPVHESTFRFPPSPPMERQSHTSLPPISTLLANMRDAQPEADRNKRARLEAGSRIDPRLSGPPTPPSRTYHLGPQRSAPTSATQQPPKLSPSYPPPHNSRQSSASSISSRPPAHHHHLSSSSWAASSARAPSPQSAPTLEPTSARSLYPPSSLIHPRAVPEYPPRTPQSPPSAGAPASQVNDYDRHHYAMPHVSQQYPTGPTSGYAAHGPPGTSTIHLSAASGPQTAHPDRYVCPQCAKAFSRPSSLRIHVHSHTGEKPFVCPHAGCGKAFSVRSNMKRHQRGCHVDGGSGKDNIEDVEIDDA